MIVAIINRYYPFSEEIHYDCCNPNGRFGTIKTMFSTIEVFYVGF